MYQVLANTLSDVLQDAPLHIHVKMQTNNDLRSLFFCPKYSGLTLTIIHLSAELNKKDE